MTTDIETGWMQTYTGKKFYPLNPNPADIDIRDIAHALSNECRYSGHVRTFYSVAQHCVSVSEHVPPEDALWGLLHDAAEAYLRDLPRPLKRRLKQLGLTWYEEAENALLQAVATRFGLPAEIPASVHEADLLLLVTESRDLMAPLHPDWHYQEANGYKTLPERVIPRSPANAEWAFLARFAFLTSEGERR